MSEYFDFAFLDGLNTADQPPNIDGFSLDDVDQFLNLGPATPVRRLIALPCNGNIRI